MKKKVDPGLDWELTKQKDKHRNTKCAEQNETDVE